MDVFLSVLLPIIITGVGNLVIFWLQYRKDKDKNRAEVIESMEESISGLLSSLSSQFTVVSSIQKQLTETRKEAQELRLGCKRNEAQLEAAGLEPEFRSNGLLASFTQLVKNDVDSIRKE